MIDELKQAIDKMKELPEDQQVALAKLIRDELNWDSTFTKSQDALSTLAQEGLREYKDGKTSDSDW